MSFEVPAVDYDAFMGRFSEPLAGEFLAFAGAVPEGARALDVGCGPGALTRRLVEAVGVGRVSAVEEWWAPYTLGVGPAGAYVRSLDDEGRRCLREHCAELLPAPPSASGPTPGPSAPAGPQTHAVQGSCRPAARESP